MTRKDTIQDMTMKKYNNKNTKNTMSILIHKLILIHKPLHKIREALKKSAFLGIIPKKNLLF